MKSHMEISFFGFPLPKKKKKNHTHTHTHTHVQRKCQVDVRRFILQKRKWSKKILFRLFDQKQKCSVFTFVQYILSNDNRNTGKVG